MRNRFQIALSCKTYSLKSRNFLNSFVIMPQFWDCSIVIDLNNLGNTIELIKECKELGYFGVVLNYIIDIQDIKKNNDSLNSFLNNDFDKILQFFYNKINIRKRLTMRIIPNSNRNKYNNSNSSKIDINEIMNDESNKSLFDKFDLISISVNDFFMNRSMLSSIIKCEEIDIINLDHVAINEGYRNKIATNTSFKQLIRSSKSKINAHNKYFEVSLNAFKANIQNIILTVNIIGSIIGGINGNFILSTGSNKKLKCKQPNDLLNVTNLFNSKFKSSKLQNCISKNIENALEKSKINRIAFGKCVESQPLDYKNKNKSFIKDKCPKKDVLETENEIKMEVEISSSTMLAKKQKHIKQDTHKKSKKMSANLENKSNSLQKLSTSPIGKRKWKNKKFKRNKSKFKTFKK